MIAETTRSSLGWGDFEAFVYLKDSAPVLQLFDNPEGDKTLFWRGRASFASLMRSLRSLSDDLRQFVNDPREDFTKFTARYLTGDGMSSFEYVTRVRVASEREAVGHHDDYVRARLDEITFARYDLISSVSRLTVWSDLKKGSARTEVGVTAPTVLPAVFGFVKETSFTSFIDPELDQLANYLNLHTDAEMVEA